MNQPIQFGKYFLLERINMGGMAEVFRAKAYGVEGFERLVAVKRILPSISEDKEFIRMFIDEAKIAVQLSHANIAQVFDLGRVGGSYYIALEHVHGRDLRALYDRCRENGEAMPVAQACLIIMKACEGLDYAHQKRNESGEPLGLVHRDVSPQNILVSFEGEVKIIDFGIAKAAGRCSKTQAGILKGKFAYMSPEQVRGLPIDRRSDIFSTGIVLYELLTGKRLFVGESDFSTLEKVRKAEITPPSTYNARIPKALERIVLKALARDRNERYQNAIDLHDDLQSFVYSSGEFYSRKDLAGWLKGSFANEIASEAAKLEAYRQLRPPEAPRTTFGRVENDTRPVTSIIAHGGGNVTAQTALERHRSATNADGRTRMTQSSAWDQSNGGAFAGQTFDSEFAYGRNSTTAHVTSREIISPRQSRFLRKPAPAARPELVGEGSTPVPTVDAQLIGLTPMPSVEERRVMLQTPTRERPQPQRLMPPEPMPEPEPQPAAVPPLVITQVASVPHPQRYPEPVQIAPASPMLMMPDDVRLQPPRMVRRSRGSGASVLTIAILFLVAGGGGAGAYFFTTQRGLSATDLPFLRRSEKPPAVPVKATPAVATTTPAREKTPVDSNTGFDLVVEPRGAQVRLNGKLLGESPPLSIRNLPPGQHKVEVQAPEGFKDVTETVTVRPGQAQRVSIKLSPSSLRASFQSNPPGADVILFADGKEQKLGATPVSVDLDANTSYIVSFEKSGFTTLTQPLRAEESDVELAVTLEKNAVRAAPPAARTRIDSDAEDFVPSDRADFAMVREALERPSTRTREEETIDDEIAADLGDGTLAISAKPPCRILIDNADTGQSTPQRSLKMPAGNHKITLVNDEYGIRDSFRVRIRAGQVTRQIRDLTDQIR